MKRSGHRARRTARHTAECRPHAAALAAMLLALASPADRAAAQSPSVEEIIDRVDDQMTFASQSATATMLITTAGETREKRFRMFSRGQDDAFMVFERPKRDSGTKFLKLGEQLWIYFPRTEKTVKISGHLLRQSMLGSDFSYEDLTENPRLLLNYDGRVLSSETVDGVDCWLIQLEEKTKGMSYPSRKLWISKESYVPLREERFAKTGRLLKTVRYLDPRRFGERSYPTRVVMEDKLRLGSRTEIVLEEIKFHIPEPEGIFDRRNLRRNFVF